jgi:hypothetical protein
MVPDKRNAEKGAFRRRLKEVKEDWKGKHHFMYVRRKIGRHW